LFFEDKDGCVDARQLLYKTTIVKVSIITAVYNEIRTIRGCVESVRVQSYADIEHIIIDGDSTDGTVAVLENYRDCIATIISEPDNGIYDAMNKGIKAATGDIIGILNSDDMYADELVIENVVNCLSENNVQTCYGDLVYVDHEDTDKVIRHWKSGNFFRERFKKGWMPPHPTFFVKKDIYDQYGIFNLEFPLASDYELMLRFLYKYNVSTAYIPKFLVKMRTGGRCRPGILNTSKNVIENYRAWKINGLNPTPITFILKPLSMSAVLIELLKQFCIVKTIVWELIWVEPVMRQTYLRACAQI
jgi:glycosyltransferase